MTERIPGGKSSHIAHDIREGLGIDHPRPPRVLMETLVARKAALAEGTQLPEATPQQLFASQVLFALRVGDLITTKAKQYHDLHPHLPIPDELSKEVKQTRTALTTLYVLNVSKLRLDKWRRKWGEKKFRDYEKMLENLMPEIVKQKAATVGNASLIKDEEREEIIDLSKKHKFSGNFRETLVTETEPNVQQRQKERRNVKISAGLSLPTIIGGHLISLSATGATIAQSAVELGPIYDWKSLTAVAVASGVSALTIYANYRAQLHLLKEVGISPGIGAKLADYVTKRYSPGDEKLYRRRILMATAIPTVWLEPLLIAGLFVPGGPLAFVAYQAGASVVNLIEAGGSEGVALGATVFRKRKEKRARKQQPPEISTP